MATQPRLKRMRGGAVAEFSEAQQVQRKSKPVLLIKVTGSTPSMDNFVNKKLYLIRWFLRLGGPTRALWIFYSLSSIIMGAQPRFFVLQKRILRTVVQISFSVVFGSSERNQPSAIFSADSRWWWWAELSWAERRVLRLAPANLKYSDESERRVFSRERGNTRDWVEEILFFLPGNDQGSRNITLRGRSVGVLCLKMIWMFEWNLPGSSWTDWLII